MSIFYFSKFSSEYNSSNFGDDINPELLGRLFSKRLIASENVCILGVGTILNDHNIKAVDSFKKKVIFSSGVGYGAVTNDLDESWDVVCVRGPKSAEALKVGAEKAVCDGAILLSDYYEVFPESCRCISVTFIPHLKTHWSAGKALKKITQSLGINYLSPDVTQVDFIKQVSQSKLVITEAMHGAILADTMRVPWLPIQIYEHNRFKWEDWFQSINQNYSSRKMNVSIWNSPKSIVKRSIKAPYQAVKSGLIAQQISQWASSNEAIMSSDALLSEKSETCKKEWLTLMKNMKMISVIMPAFNAEKYIGRSVESILNQSYKDFELLVVDDGSIDATKNIVEEIVGSDHRVRIVDNVFSKGASGARNTGIMEAKGGWIAFLDCDDLWYVDTLLQRANAVKKYPKCDVFTSDYNIWFPEDSDLEFSISSHNDVWKKYFSKSNIDGKFLLMYKPIEAFIESTLTHTSVIMVRSDLLRTLGGFDESLNTYEDVLLWLKISAYSQCMVYIPFVGSRYRQRLGSLTHSGKPQTKDAPLVFRKLLNDPAFGAYRELLKKNIIHHLNLNTYWYRNNGFKFEAIKSAVAGVFAGPFNRTSLKNLLASLFLR